MSNFPERLDELLNGRNATRFAEQLDVHKATVSSWRCGRTTPDLDMIVRLAGELNVTTDYLVGVSDNRVRTDLNGARPPLGVSPLFTIDKGKAGIVLCRVIRVELVAGSLKEGETFTILTQAIADSNIEGE